MSYHVGDTISIGGIEFIILDTIPDEKSGKDNFLLLTSETQGKTRFGKTNEYKTSLLKDRMQKWLDGLIKNSPVSEYLRVRSIVALQHDDDGYQAQTIEGMVLPLASTEYERYKELIPEHKDLVLLPNGFGAHGHVVFVMNSEGNWDGLDASRQADMWPTILVSSEFFENQKEMQNGQIDLSMVSTDDLLNEIRRRLESYKED
jgi:hypothetical protein